MTPTSPDLSAQLFQLIRFNILTSALSPATKDKLGDGYVYAWENLVYPLFHDTGADWHKPFPSNFAVTRDMITELSEHLDKLWIDKIPIPSVYDVEDLYRARREWDRMKIVFALRYMWLCNLFDEPFWVQIMSNHPSEGSWITRKYDREKDLYFI